MSEYISIGHVTGAEGCNINVGVHVGAADAPIRVSAHRDAFRALSTDQAAALAALLDTAAKAAPKLVSAHSAYAAEQARLVAETIGTGE